MLTDIDGAIDMTNNQKWGRIHPIYDVNFFSQSLKEVSKQQEMLRITCEEIQNFARANLNWHYLIEKIARILGEEPAQNRS